MKLKYSIYIIILVLVYSCQKSSEVNINDLKGYWEIEHVALFNGKTFDYTFNKTIDYYHFVDSLSGYKKKVAPNFSGTYQASTDKQLFKVLKNNDSIFIYYKSPINERKECILFLNDKQLKVINQNKDVFLYKRYIPIQID